MAPTLHLGILQLKITLDGVEPPVWRRVLVPREITFFKLHQIIQRAMGWKDCHQHQFISDRGSPLKATQEKTLRLNQTIKAPGATCRYEYDFGDSWQHTVLVENILPLDELRTYPLCLDGARACPPEDCGGVPGYEETLEILADPKHPDHDERVEWIGGAFDPEKFDLAVTNTKFRRFKLRLSGGAAQVAD